MLTTTHTVELGASASDVWTVVGDFGGLIEVMGSPVSTEGHGVGALRRIGPTGDVVERLEAQDDQNRLVRYSIVESGSMPLKNYEAVVSVSAIGEQRSAVTWTATFEADGIEDAHAVKLVSKILRLGVQSLQTKFGA